MYPLPDFGHQVALGHAHFAIDRDGLVRSVFPVSYTHLRAHETVLDLVCRLLLEKKKEHQSNLNVVATVIHIITDVSTSQSI